MASPSPISEVPTSLVCTLEASKGGVQTPRGGCGKGLRGGKVLGGLLKGTHINLSFKSPLLPPLPPPFILTLVYPCCGPPRSPAPRLIEAVYSARTRGPKTGTMASFRETINPMAERGSLQGGQPTPFPQTSQHSATLSAYTYMSHTYTPCFCLPPTSQNVALRSVHCQNQGDVSFKHEPYSLIYLYFFKFKL